MVTVTICVGSSCHVKGSRRLISALEELVKRHDLGDQVELKGAFCMERCGEGLNWQIGDEPVTSQSIEEAVATFTERVMGPRPGGPGA